MPRPKKPIRIKENADSLQFFENGVYVGSFSLKKLLCQLKERNGTAQEKPPITAQNPKLESQLTGTKNNES